MLNVIFYVFFTVGFHSVFGQDALSYPCALDDIRCIRYILAENSDCNLRTWGSVPNVIRFNDVVYDTPSFNITVSQQYVIYRNLDKCKVSAFFFNLNRNRLVMAITCPNITSQDNLVIQAHRNLMEDRYFYYQTQATFDSIIFTVDLPHADEIDLCNQFAYPYLTSVPRYRVAPKGPAAATFIDYGPGSALFDRLNFYSQEAVSQRSNTIFQYWVNSVLCDFDNFCTTN